jgi:hypothetical protein
MKFSIFYRLNERDKFFDKFFKKEKEKISPEICKIVEFNYRETLEIIVNLIINENKNDLKILLARSNAKIARTFFDYIMNLKTKNMSKEAINKCIDEAFAGDKNEKIR